MPIITTLWTRAPSLSRRRRASTHELLDDLAGREVAAEPHRAGRAERARERTARLRGQADRAAVAVPHRDRLDRVAVGGAQPQLDRAVSGDLLGLDDELAQRCALVERHAQRARQRRDLVPGLGVLGERGAARLRHAIGRLVAFGEQSGWRRRCPRRKPTRTPRRARWNYPPVWKGAPGCDGASSCETLGTGWPPTIAAVPPARSDGPLAAATTDWGSRPVAVEMSNDASGTSATGCSRAGVTPPSGAELSSHALTYAIRRHGPLPGRVDLEVQVERRALRVARVAEEADHVAGVHLRARLRDRGVGREVAVVEEVPVGVAQPLLATADVAPADLHERAVVDGQHRRAEGREEVDALVEARIRARRAEVVLEARAAGEREEVARAEQRRLRRGVDRRIQRVAARGRRVAARGAAVGDARLARDVGRQRRGRQQRDARPRRSEWWRSCSSGGAGGAALPPRSGAAVTWLMPASA